MIILRLLSMFVEDPLPYNFLELKFVFKRFEFPKQYINMQNDILLTR